MRVGVSIIASWAGESAGKRCWSSNIFGSTFGVGDGSAGPGDNAEIASDSVIDAMVVTWTRCRDDEFEEQ